MSGCRDVVVGMYVCWGGGVFNVLHGNVLCGCEGCCMWLFGCCVCSWGLCMELLGVEGGGGRSLPAPSVFMTKAPTWECVGCCVRGSVGIFCGDVV